MGSVWRCTVLNSKLGAVILSDTNEIHNAYDVSGFACDVFS